MRAEEPRPSGDDAGGHGRARIAGDFGGRESPLAARSSSARSPGRSRSRSSSSRCSRLTPWTSMWTALAVGPGDRASGARIERVGGDVVGRRHHEGDHRLAPSCGAEGRRARRGRDRREVAEVELAALRRGGWRLDRHLESGLRGGMWETATVSGCPGVTKPSERTRALKKTSFTRFFASGWATALPRPQCRADPARVQRPGSPARSFPSRRTRADYRRTPPASARRRRSEMRHGDRAICGVFSTAACANCGHDRWRRGASRGSFQLTWMCRR